jgi:hypothetical protein
MRSRRRLRRTRALVELAQGRLWGCDACRSDDSYDFVDDVLRPLRLRKRERKRLSAALTCPNCESAVPLGTFALAESPEAIRRLQSSRRFDRLHKPALEDFRDFLLSHPMLGAGHPFGQRLAKAVSPAKKCRVEPGRWFRATDRIEAPYLGPRPAEQVAMAHRFNLIGQAAWYLGSDARTAAVEVLREPQPGVRFAIAEIEILEPITTLDLRLPFADENPTGSWILREVVARRFISEPTDDVDVSRPQYRVPQFVADLARQRGFRGILYDSSRPSAYNNPEAWGTNLVLFDPFPCHKLKPIEVMEFGQPDFDPFGLDRWPLRSFSQLL